MEIQTLLIGILLGAILGITGQGIRVIVGIKKENDKAEEEAKAAGKKVVRLYESLNNKRLLISLLIGLVAGILSYLFLLPEGEHEFTITPTKANVLAMIASGYAGTDFIEGFINRYLPKND
jgi:hypothetical protein